MSSLVVRHARVGDHLPRTVVDRARPRRLEATALVLPGAGDADPYLSVLRDHAGDFGDWDGRVVVLEPDGEERHRVAIVDRYGQVYATHDAEEAIDLPGPGALVEWFRFLATACPECGVLDEAVLVGPTR